MLNIGFGKGGGGGGGAGDGRIQKHCFLALKGFKTNKTFYLKESPKLEILFLEQKREQVEYIGKHLNLVLNYCDEIICFT